MRTLLVVALLLGAVPASAQVVVRVAAGVDANRLGGLRNTQEQALAFARSGLGVPAEITDAFPPYLSLRADLVVPTEPDFNVGVEVGTSSTAGRVDYQDRTGIYRLDLAASRVYVGGYGEWVLERRPRYTLAATLRNRYSLTTLDLDETLTAAGESFSARSETGRQSAYSLQPEVTADVVLAGPVRLRLQGGWEQVILLGERSGGSPAGPVNWSGPRVGVGLAVGD